MGEDFNYAEEFKTLNLDALKRDLVEVMTTSPGLVAGRLRPLRAALHPDDVACRRASTASPMAGAVAAPALGAAPSTVGPTTNLDKARRLLWPIKQKYGRKISWADLLSSPATLPWNRWGSRRLASASKARGHLGARRDLLGPEDTWLGDERYSGDGRSQTFRRRADGPDLRESGRAQRQPDPLAAARDIRETFGRMAMNDEETVALIVGGHTFGKTHGAVGAEYVGPEPEAAPLEARASAGGTPSAAARAPTRSPAGWRAAHGPTSRRSGTTGSWTTCSSTTGSSRRAPPVRSSGLR